MSQAWYQKPKILVITQFILVNCHVFTEVGIIVPTLYLPQFTSVIFFARYYAFTQLNKKRGVVDAPKNLAFTSLEINYSFPT